MYVPEPRRVIVGFDGSPNSRAGLRRGVQEARRRHAQLDIVQVVPAGPSGVLRKVGAWLRLRNAVARAIPPTQHISTVLRIVGGEPGEVLPRLASSAELLVIGGREQSEHAFSGATVSAVLASSPCHVVICADHHSSRVSIAD